MIPAITDFHERTKEVTGYFDFLERLNGNENRLYIHTNGNPPTSFPIDDALIKTLKATAFLLLYNLVESTMTNAIQAIYDELKIKNISFSKVSDDIKKIVLRNFKNIRVTDLHTQIIDLSVDIITIGFRRRDLFSGNVDARLIGQTARQYGFSHYTIYASTRNGESLLTVKTNRNDLAHGFKSFSEVGKEYSIAELMKVEKEVVAYLEGILGNIDQYIINGDYLA